MRKSAVFVFFFCALVLLAGSARSDPLTDLMEQFTEEYNAMKPQSQYSSVDTDYRLKQAVLGTVYTTKALGLLYNQNQQLIEKYDEMIQKYDQVIEQNKRIIELLSMLAKGKEKKEKVPEYGVQSTP